MIKIASIFLPIFRQNSYLPKIYTKSSNFSLIFLQNLLKFAYFYAQLLSLPYVYSQPSVKTISETLLEGGGGGEVKAVKLGRHACVTGGPPEAKMRYSYFLDTSLCLSFSNLSLFFHFYFSYRSYIYVHLSYVKTLATNTCTIVDKLKL